MPDSEPGSGHTDSNHDWQTLRVLRVPTGFPDFMQFRVTLLECANCQAQMTRMGSGEDEETYRTPRCGEQGEWEEHGENIQRPAV